MNVTSSTSLSGMNAAQTRLQASANNIANSNTEGYRRQEVSQQQNPSGGVTTAVTQRREAGAALEEDVVQQLEAKNAYLANLAVFKRNNEMAGALLNAKA